MPDHTRPRKSRLHKQSHRGRGSSEGMLGGKVLKSCEKELAPPGGLVRRQQLSLSILHFRYGAWVRLSACLSHPNIIWFIMRLWLYIFMQPGRRGGWKLCQALFHNPLLSGGLICGLKPTRFWGAVATRQLPGFDSLPLLFCIRFEKMPEYQWLIAGPISWECVNVCD